MAIAERAGTRSSGIEAFAPTAAALQVSADFLEKLPFPIYACDAESRILWFNRRAAELWGRTPRPGDKDESAWGGESPVARVLQTGLPLHDIESTFARPDGSRVFVRIHIESEKDENGAVIGAIICFHETTAFRRSEETLRESNKRLAAIYEHAEVGIVEVDANGRLQRVNTQLATLLGCSAEELIGHSIFDETYFDDTDMDRAQFQRQVKGEIDRYSVEKRFKRKDGRYFWASVTSSSIRDAQGRFLYAVRVKYDISERKRAEARLRESEQHFQNLLAAVPAAIYTTDAHGRITYFNEAAAALAGRAPVIGSDKWCVTWKLYWPDGTPMPHDQCPMAVTLKEGRPIRHTEAIAERPDGTRIPIIPYPTPLRDAAGEVVGAVNMLIDISELRRAESQQNMLLSELNHRVKNNMQVLQSLLRQSARRTSNEEARKVLADAGGRIAAMAAAQRVLYGVANATHFNAKEFLGAVCQTVQQTFSHNLKIAYDADPSELSNDMAMPLALILNELLSNAIKYGQAPGGDSTIRVGLTREAESFLLYVEDDGPGFDLDLVRNQSSGLRLVEGLARQLRGRFDVARDPATRCSLQFA